MKRRLLTLCIIFAFINSANAGDIYTYKDKDGITVISDTPVPEKYQKKAKKLESYKLSSSEEKIQRYNAEQAAIEKKNAEEARQKQQINETKEEASKQNERQQAQPQ